MNKDGEEIICQSAHFRKLCNFQHAMVMIVIANLIKWCTQPPPPHPLTSSKLFYQFGKREKVIIAEL